jgi:hypothetical protein
MKHSSEKKTTPLRVLLALCCLGLSNGVACASIAYGSINNFDTVNDTGVECHGFEIELDDIHSTDITYTYDWNHYGTPTITEDNTDPLHPKVFVRYASARTNGVWEAYTAVPSGPIAPTQGHQFTNPSTNFGGEHFGVGYRGVPTGIKYCWLKDNGAGVLTFAGAVIISTPTFAYVPPAAGMPAQVQAAIVPPPPPAPSPLEFGPASWVKEIRTTTHNNNEVKLRNLISPDPDWPDIKDWRNGEPDEVEVEWQILQTDYHSAGGGPNGKLEGAPEDLPNGDEVITRRYEFYKYVGPIDAETGEALGATTLDGTNGIGIYSNTVVVGEYLGAQMSALDVDAPLGLIDHLPDGEVDVPYPERTVVITGTTSFVATTSGALPTGMTFDPVSGQVSGTPTVSGVFQFHVQASSSNNPVVTRTYLFTIAEAGVMLPPHSSVDTSVAPAKSGTTTGNDVYLNGANVTVAAIANPGFAFVNWTENGAPVSGSASYEFTIEVNRSLVANFVPAPQLSFSTPQANTLVILWPTNFSGFVLQHSPDLGTPNWLDAANPVTVVGTNNQVIISPLEGRSFFRLSHP